MADDQVIPEVPSGLSDDEVRRIDEVGRRAGAALRSPAPQQGVAVIAGHARRRRQVVGAAVGAAILVAGVAVLRSGKGSDEEKPANSIVTSVPSTRVPLTTPDPTSTFVSVVQTGPLKTTLGGTLTNGIIPRYSSDGSLLAIAERFSDSSGDAEATVLIHDSDTMTPLRELPCPVALGAESVEGTGDGPDLVWDLDEAEQWDSAALSVLMSQDRGARLCGIELSADGQRALVAADVTTSGPPTQLVWSTSDGSLLGVYPGSSSWFVGDGSQVLTITDSGMQVWDTATDEMVAELTGESVGFTVSTDAARVLRWGPPTDRVAAGVGATVYDSATLSPLVTLSAATPDGIIGLVDAAIDPTGRLVATRQVDRVTLWDATSGAELRQVTLDLAVTPGGVSFSRDGALMAVPRGSRVGLYDTASGETLADLDLDTESPVSATTAVFSNNDFNLAVAVDASGPSGVVGVQEWFFERT